MRDRLCANFSLKVVALAENPAAQAAKALVLANRRRIVSPENTREAAKPIQGEL